MEEKANPGNGTGPARGPGGRALFVRACLLAALALLTAFPLACKTRIGTQPTRTVPPTPTYTLGPGCATPVLRDITAHINNGPVTGNTCGFWKRLSDHGRGVDSPEQLYLVRLADPATLTVSLCGGADWDTYLYLRGSCSDEWTDLAFNDDFCAPSLQSQITAALPAGTYYLVVDGWGEAIDCGPFSMTLTDAFLTPTPTITLVADLSPTHTPTITATPTLTPTCTPF